MRALVFAAGAALAGCTNLLGIQELSGPGGPGPIDAALDAPPTGGDAGDGSVPGRIAVTGTVINGGQQQPIVTDVELLDAAGTVLQKTTSDQTGKFTLTVSTNGAPLDATLHVLGRNLNLRDAYWLSSSPLVADRDTGPVSMASEQQIQMLAALFNLNYTPQMTVIAIQARSSAGALAAGAQIATDFPNAIIRYTSGGLPGMTNATSADGLAYVFDFQAAVMAVSSTGTVIAGPRRLRNLPMTVFEIELRDTGQR